MEYKFRTLRADEIELRVGVQTETGASLLLYKDSRCDMNILDEAVGPTNWQRRHARENANCIVSIWDERKEQWIEKEDTGTESKTEAEKGLASDSFKRACVNWGIGRELYTAPFVWCNMAALPTKARKGKTEIDASVLVVSAVEYSDARRITKLEITNEKTGEIVFRFPRGNRANATVEKVDKVPPVEEPRAFDPVAAIKELVQKLNLSNAEFAACRDSLIEMHLVPDLASKDMTEGDVRQLAEAFEKVYGEAS